MVDAIQPLIDRGLLAQYVQRAPERPRGAASIYFSNIDPAMHAHFCRIKCCPHHNDEFQIFGNGNDGLEEALLHGLEFYSAHYYSLRDEERETIRWFKCVESCGDLSLGLKACHQHQQACAEYQVVAFMIEAARQKEAADEANRSRINASESARQQSATIEE